LREKLGYSDEAEIILKRCLPHFNEDTLQAAGSVYGTLAWIAFKRGEGEHARELAEEGLVRMPHDTTDAGYALLLNTVATLAFYRGDTEVARAYWQRCLEVYEALADRKGIANMYNNLGVLAAQAGDRLRARDLWGRCATISREIDDIQRLAGIYNNLGIDSLETGNLREAEENYLRALALFRRMESPREQAEILSNLGELAYQRADYTRALAYLNEAVNRASEIGDQETKLEPMVYMGKLLLTLEEVEESEKLLHSAQEIAAMIGTRKAEGQAWEGLAALFARRNEFDRASAAADRASELLADEADPLALLHLHLTRCQIAAESGLKDQIQVELDNARKVADTKWDPFTAARTQLTESLYVGVPLEPAKWQVALRKLSIYPDLLWKFHWATARQFTRTGQPKKALDEYGRGVAVLKAIAARLPEEKQTPFLHAPHILKFRQEAVELHKSLQAQR
jgi:tetratricopeptide (TPR) repeat protein